MIPSEPGLVTNNTAPSDKLCIRRLRSTSTIEVNVDINGHTVAVVIDTAAQVTIISDKFYNFLSKKPSILKVQLHTAGRDLSMKGFKVGPVSVSLGSQVFTVEEVYISPIDDNMLLGLDFLLEHRMVVNMDTGNLEIGHERILMNSHLEGSPSELKVEQVVVLKITKIPPGSVVLFPCNVGISLNNYVVSQ